MNIVECISGRSKLRITLTPNQSVAIERFRDDQFVSIRRLTMGDEVEFDYYNKRVTGPIMAIGKKTVTVTSSLARGKRVLSAAEFGWKNWHSVPSWIRQLDHSYSEVF